MDSKGHVLVVKESGPEMSRALKRLKAWDPGLIEVPSPKAVLDHFHHDVNVDLVVTPLHDRAKGGIQLLAKVRNLGFRVPFVFISTPQTEVLKSQAEVYRLVAFLDDGASEKLWKEIYFRALHVGRTFREIARGLESLCNQVNVSADRILELQKLQERFFEPRLEARLKALTKLA